MSSNEPLFAKGRPAVYQGNIVTAYRFDNLIIPQECSLVVQFESTSSEWRQGIFLGDMTRRTSASKTNLQLTVAGQTAPGIKLWSDKWQPQITIQVVSPQRRLYLYNIWDAGNGQSSSLVDGAAMLIENLYGTGMKRYHCNDGHVEQTFTNIVFSIKII